MNICAIFTVIIIIWNLGGDSDPFVGVSDRVFDENMNNLDCYSFISYDCLVDGFWIIG